MKLALLASILTLVPMMGCANRGNDVPHCVPGAIVTCPYTDGGTGVQTCGMDGTWSPCGCAPGSCAPPTSDAMTPDVDGANWVPTDGGPLPTDGSPPNDIAATPGPKYVFITSLTYTGNLGGLTGADNICSTLAASAGHAGVWVAWLSDENTNAIDRINDVGPWYGMGTNTVVAYTKAGFAYTPVSAVGRDQNGAGNTNQHDIWTGTQLGGTRIPGSTCQGWTSTAMQLGAAVREYGPGTAGWTYGSSQFCTNGSAAYLACIQQ